MKQEEKSKLSRDIIIDAAIEEFGANAYGKASTSAMCRRRNISKGKLYHHFENKDEIFLAAIERSYDILLESYNEAAKNFGGTLKENLMQIVYFRSSMSIQQKHVPLVIWRAMQAPPLHLQKEVQTIVARGHERTSEITKKAIENSTDSISCDMELCIDSISMVLNHIAFHAIKVWSASNDEDNAKAALGNRPYAEKCIDLILYGIVDR